MQNFSPWGRYTSMREKKIFSFLSFLSNNPILAMICIVFFIADIVLLTCIIYDRIHRKEVMEMRSNYNELRKSKEELDGMLKGMRASYDQMSKKLNSMDPMHNELEKRTGQAQPGLDSSVASLTADLNICQSTNLNFISQISDKESTIGSLKNQLHDYEEITAGLKKLLAQQLALEPTWIKAGEVFTAFNGDFVIVVDEASDKNQCMKGSTAAVSLKSKNDKRILCVQMDQPESFKYKGKKYFIDLLGVRENEQTREYLVSILKERGKS
jgi:predicted RNase H-like nuclease (RuvC/YqgF family)